MKKAKIIFVFVLFFSFISGVISSGEFFGEMNPKIALPESTPKRSGMELVDFDLVLKKSTPLAPGNFLKMDRSELLNYIMNSGVHFEEAVNEFLLTDEVFYMQYSMKSLLEEIEAERLIKIMA